MKLLQEGPRSARILICGEAPGETEVSTGLPFQGYSGEMLTNMLGRAGIRRHECFITNLCHIRPPGNIFEWFYKPANQLHYIQGVIQLKKDIEEIKPNLVIALGAHPLRALTGKRAIGDWRGSILSSSLVKGQKVIGTFHPAAILLVWDYKAIADFDLARCREEAGSPVMNLPHRDLYLPPNLVPESIISGAHTLHPYTSTIIEEMYNAEWLACDIETVERDDGSWRISCVGFSDRCSRALTLAMDGAESELAIRRLLGGPARKIFQNGNIFDVPVLLREGYPVANFAWDTMLGHHSIFPESAGGEDEMSKLEKKKKQAALRKGLAFQTSIYTREPRYKDDGKLWHNTGDVVTFYRYNGLDAAVTREIRDVQAKELAESDCICVIEHAMSLVEPLMAMTRKGIKIDMAIRARLKHEAEVAITRLQAFLEAGAGTAINVESGKQVMSFLYGTLKLPTKFNKKTKRPTANKDAIGELAHKYNHPLLMAIVEIRQRRKTIETYLNAGVDPDGRMRCSWDPTGTRTGRLSSRASLSGSGTNLQNQPTEMREMFVADSGCMFIYRDYSQAEARVVAALASDSYLLTLFSDSKRDIHKETAASIFGISIDKVTPEQRYTAKRVRHAVNYGMDAARFVQVVNEDARDTGIRIDYQLARKVIDGFFLLHPNHKSVYWRNVEDQIKQSRTLVNAFGRKRTFFGRMDDKLLRDAYSYIPQSTVGDLCCKALVKIYNDIQLGRKDLDVSILLNVHDSVLVMCPDSKVTEVSNLMAKAMDIPFLCNGHKVSIPTDCKVGRDWRNLSELVP